jgi:hypothetical protein
MRGKDKEQRKNARPEWLRAQCERQEGETEEDHRRRSNRLVMAWWRQENPTLRKGRGRKKKPKTICTADGCTLYAHANGLCSKHYMRLRVYGRLERVRALNKGVTCKVRGCDEWAKKSGYCAAHYQRLHKYKRLDEHKNKRTHPYYSLWYERKQAGALCDEWLDFWAFANAIGERSGPNHYLVKLRHEEPFGPTNFEWQEHLRRRNGESAKDWHARKWADRKERLPTWQKDREMRRRYGLDIVGYEALEREQNFRCAICEKPEAARDGKTNTVRRMAVDHCHKTGNVRGLLCWRCNTVIGKIEESLDLAIALHRYLEKHKKE